MATKVTQKHTKNNLSWYVIRIIPTRIDEIEVFLFVYNNAIVLILLKKIIRVYSIFAILLVSLKKISIVCW